MKFHLHSKPMKTLLATMILVAGLGCQAIPDAPGASTAAVGGSLDDLGRSLGNARCEVEGIRADLSEVDAKSIRIQEAIRNW